MSPIDGLLEAVHALAVAKREGRVSHEACVIAVAGAYLALGVSRDELTAEIGAVGQSLALRAMRGLLARGGATS